MKNIIVNQPKNAIVLAPNPLIRLVCKIGQYVQVDNIRIGKVTDVEIVTLQDIYQVGKYEKIRKGDTVLRHTYLRGYMIDTVKEINEFGTVVMESNEISDLHECKKIIGTSNGSDLFALTEKEIFRIVNKLNKSK